MMMYSRQTLSVSLGLDALIRRFPELEVRLSGLDELLVPNHFVSKGFYFAYGGPFRMEHNSLRVPQAYDPDGFFFFLKPAFHQLYTQVPCPAILLNHENLAPVFRERPDVMFRFLRHDHLDAFTNGRNFLTVHDYDNHLV